MSYEEALQRIKRWKRRSKLNSWLNLSCCNLTELPPLPQNVRKLNLRLNPLTDVIFDCLPNSIQMLRLSRTNITRLDKLPISLKWLVCQGTLTLVRVNIYAPNLKYVDLSGCSCLKYILDLSDAIRILILFVCMSVKKIKAFPKNMLYFYATDISLKILPEFPPTLRVLKIVDTYITTLPKLPESLVYICIRRSFMDIFPVLPISIVYVNIHIRSVDLSYSKQDISQLQLNISDNTMELYKDSTILKNIFNYINTKTPS